MRFIYVLRSERDVYRATPAVTWGFGFCGLIRSPVQTLSRNPFKLEFIIHLQALSISYACTVFKESLRGGRAFASHAGDRGSIPVRDKPTSLKQVVTA